jgi:hypothetical protein
MTPQKPRPRALRVLAVAGSLALLGVAVVRAQIGCATADPPTAAEPDPSVPVVVVSAVPPASEAGAAEVPAMIAAPAPSSDPAEPPPAGDAGAAEIDPTFFYGSKSGAFLPPPGQKAPSAAPSPSEQKAPNPPSQGSP